MKKEEKTEYPPALRWEPGPVMRQSVDNRLAADAGSTEQTNKHAAQLCYTTLTTLSLSLLLSNFFLSIIFIEHWKRNCSDGVLTLISPLFKEFSVLDFGEENTFKKL